MAHEELFLQMAVCEVRIHEGQPCLAHWEAQSRLGGAIGLYSNNREEFIAHGLEWLAGFADEVARVRAEIEENKVGDDGDDGEDSEGVGYSEYRALGLPNHAEAIEMEFRRLLDIAPAIDRERFAELLGEDWDERHEQEEEDGNE